MRAAAQTAGPLALEAALQSHAVLGQRSRDPRPGTTAQEAAGRGSARSSAAAVLSTAVPAKHAVHVTAPASRVGALAARAARARGLAANPPATALLPSLRDTRELSSSGTAAVATAAGRRAMPG